MLPIWTTNENHFLLWSGTQSGLSDPWIFGFNTLLSKYSEQITSRLPYNYNIYSLYHEIVVLVYREWMWLANPPCTPALGDLIVLKGAPQGTSCAWRGLFVGGRSGAAIVNCDPCGSEWWLLEEPQSQDQCAVAPSTSKLKWFQGMKGPWWKLGYL